MSGFVALLTAVGSQQIFHQSADAHHGIESADNQQGDERCRSTPPTVITHRQNADRRASCGGCEAQPAFVEQNFSLGWSGLTVERGFHQSRCLLKEVRTIQG